MSKVSKVKNKADRSETKVQLVVYPRRLYFNILMTLVLTILFTLWIWANLQHTTVPWYVIGLPMVFIGMLTNFMQPEEEWQYTTWQNATQKYEKNISE